MSDPHAVLPAFRAALKAGDPIPALRAGLIGRDVTVEGPYGPQPMLYADYVASGRALRQIEEVILNQVLPFYANSHTEASYCGAFVTGLREAARAEIGRLCGATEAHEVIFTGSGATHGLNRLVHLLGVREAVASGRGATVLIGPYEHHSNILPWRESGARVVEIPEAATGGPDLAALDIALAEAKGLVIGAFSAASNVSGILSDVAAITRKLKAAGALSVWDYAGGGPYLPIRMSPEGAEIDAIALSPHKFAGGPGASGLLLIRKDAVASSIPTFPGGGTVRYVSPEGHDYSLSIAEREEAGTPNVLGDIRAALAMIVKDVVGEARIMEIDRTHAARMIAALERMPGVTLLGRSDCARLPIFSVLIDDGHGGFVEPGRATRYLSDRFGIQARGGCACAGPYGHRLLGIGPEQTPAVRARVLAGDDGGKPGFLRFNLSWLMTEDEIARIEVAIAALPAGLADQQAALSQVAE